MNIRTSKSIVHPVCCLALLMTVTLAVSGADAAGPGSLDPSFRPQLAVAAGNPIRTAVVDAMGRIVAAHSNQVLRLLQDGSPDPQFNANATADGTVHVVAIDGLGRLLVGGEFRTFADQSRAGLVRLEADGTLDSSFVSPTNLSPRDVRSIAIHEDGTILTGGNFLTWNGVSVPNVARLNPEGELDVTFAANSRVALGTNKWGTVVRIRALPGGRSLIERVSSLSELNPDGTAVRPAFELARFPVWELLADGRVLLCESTSPTWNMGSARIRRLLEDGSVDPSLDILLPTDGPVLSIGVTPDERILLGGTFRVINGQRHSRLIRLHPDGQIDSSFSSEIQLDDDPDWPFREWALNLHYVSGITVLGDDSILAHGSFTSVGGIDVPGLARLRTGNGETGPPEILGTLETVESTEGHRARVGFHVRSGVPFTSQWFRDGNEVPGANDPVLEFTDLRLAHAGEYQLLVSNAMGTAVSLKTRLVVKPAPTQPGSVDLGFPAVRIEPDPLMRSFGNIEAHGDALYVFSGGPIWEGFEAINGHATRNAARLTHFGEVDPSFVMLRGHTNLAQLAGVLTMLPLQDGRVLAVVELDVRPGEPRRVLFALQPDGSVDPSFNAELPFRSPLFAPTDLDEARDGKILVAGPFETANNERYGLVRLLPDGRLDETFRPAAEMTRFIASVTVQPDNKILAILGDGGSDLTQRWLRRFLPDGSIDPEFQDLVSVPGGVRLVLVDGQGRILVAGHAAIGSVPGPVVTRLLPDGTPDPSFEVDLSFTVPPSVYASSLAVQPDGKILAFLLNFGDRDPVLVRLHPDGREDESFEFLPQLDRSVVKIVITPDEQIVIGGPLREFGGTHRIGVMKINAYDELRITSPRVSGSQFEMTLRTRPHRSYVVEASPAAAGLSWDVVQTVEGTGMPVVVTHERDQSRFYRARIDDGQ